MNKEILQSEYYKEEQYGRIDTNVTWLFNDDRGEVEEIEITPDEFLYVGLPKVPKNKKDILFHDLPKKKQYWRVKEPPAELNRDTAKFYTDYIEQELDRVEKGVWFFNDGKPTYITGLHYYYINHVEIDVGHPDYRERDRFVMYTLRVAEIHPQVKGVIQIKGRRIGSSYIAAALSLHRTSSAKNALSGIVSKTGIDAKTFFTDKLVPMFQSLPFFLQPLTSSGSDPKTALVFKKPRESSKKIAKEGTDTNIGLNSRIEWRNTGVRVFDSTKQHCLILDESAKLEGKEGRNGQWIGIDLMKMWGVLSKTLGLKKKVGIAFVPSTIDELSKGGQQFKDLYESSLLVNIGANGTTPSGLIAYFIPAFDGLEGYIDIYGRSVIDDPEKPVMGVDGDMITQGSKAFLLNERNAQVSERALIEMKREMPFTIREAFYDKAGNSIFDLGKIQSQLDWLESNDTGKLTTKGYFRWKNGERDTEVEFIHADTGDWELSWLPPPEMRNKYKLINNRKTPAHALDFAGGVDSYDINITSDQRGSNGAVAFYCREASSNSSIPSEIKGEFFGVYNGRTRYAEMFYEQVIMATFYYGSPMLAENNKPRILQYFKERGYGEYMVVRPDKHPKDLTKNEKELKGIPSTEQTVISHAEILQQHIDLNVGVKEDGTMGKCYIVDLLNDWRKFEIDNRTRYDLTIASGYALMLGKKTIKPITIPKGFNQAYFKKYDNKGNISKRLK